MEKDREKLQRYASKILIAVKDGLVAKYPFLARAVYGLEDKALVGAEAFALDGAATGTDGQYFICDAGRFVSDYTLEKADTEEIYLHSILHCLYMHPFLAGKRKRELWDLACDIYIWNVEGLLRSGEVLRSGRQGQQVRQMQQMQRESPAWQEDARRQVLGQLRKQISALSAQSIYRFLERGGNAGWEETYSAAQLAELFRVDDHSMWYAVNEERQAAEDTHKGNTGKIGRGTSGTGEAAEDKGNPGKGETNKGDARTDDAGTCDARTDGAGKDAAGAGRSNGGADGPAMASARADAAALAERWGDIAEYAEAGLGLKLAEHIPAQGDQAGELLESLRGIEREFEDYAGFLQKFAVLEERMQVDMDAFDFIYYTYGLELFHDTPLIEPLEYKEMKAIHEFVVAIDTSGSCDLGLVRRFLVKTFDILHTSTVFWGKLRIYIIQCDAAIQQELCITALDELQSYAEHMEIHGRGGTDFRPVFERVEALREEGVLSDLRGLLYFTDGYGSYPVRPTDYKTAFVFAQMDAKVPVPPWAMRIYIEDIADF